MWMRVLTCVGAVTGAGFASGREIVSFFSRYGRNSWLLICVSAALMAFLCYAVLRTAQNEWKRISQLCAAALMMVTSGAMIAASGQITALLWPNDWAYSIGAVGTLLAAWKTGSGRLKGLGIISSFSTVLLVVTLVVCLFLPATEAAVFLPANRGVFNAAAYAGMNMTLATGVIRNCARERRRENLQTAILFGVVMLALLCLSNALYLRHPLAQDTPFPIVRLLSRFGRTGFVLSAALLEFAIFTTLASVLFALRMMVKQWIHHPLFKKILTLGLPLWISCRGFDGIVDAVYAPVGMICLVAVFLPLLFLCFRQRKA